jgi:hypothetical protein
VSGCDPPELTARAAMMRILEESAVFAFHITPITCGQVMGKKVSYFAYPSRFFYT